MGRALPITMFLAVAVPILFFAAFTPSRRLVPSIVGLDCDSQGICAESWQQLQRAQPLYEDSKQFVQGRLGRLEHPLHTIFCQSDWCASYFGLSGSKAQTTGLFGTVIGRDAWVPYLVRHELIHQIQNERMGIFRLHSGPEWFLEGMAYSLSDDPRADLGVPWQEHRARFDSWYAATGSANLWAAAKVLR